MNSSPHPFEHAQKDLLHPVMTVVALFHPGRSVTPPMPLNTRHIKISLEVQNIYSLEGDFDIHSLKNNNLCA